MDYLGTADYLTSPLTGKVESWTHYNEWGEITHNAVLKCGQRELDILSVKINKLSLMHFMTF